MVPNPNKYYKKNKFKITLPFLSLYKGQSLYNQTKIIVKFTKIYMKKNKMIISGETNKMMISGKMNRVIENNFKKARTRAKQYLRIKNK
jgi:hypothetical protein